MKLLLLLILIVNYSFATTIYDIWSPEKDGEGWLVLAADGNVYDVSEELARELEIHLNEGSEISFNLSEQKSLKRKRVIGFQVLNTKQNLFPEDIPTPMDNYNPTVIDSMPRALEIFDTMRQRSRSRGQCFNRAYVWSYEMHKQFGVKSTKTWLFFTKKFIREYRYHWWFHVSPSISVKNENDYILMDRKYMKTPVGIEEWKNYFMRNEPKCPVVSKYSDYRDHQEENYCYYMHSSMYFWQPLQLENLESGRGDLKTEFNFSELKKAYRNGFGIWIRGGQWP